MIDVTMSISRLFLVEVPDWGYNCEITDDVPTCLALFRIPRETFKGNILGRTRSTFFEFHKIRDHGR